MSRPLLKLGGDSGDILSDVLRLPGVSEAETVISGAEGRDELRHIRMSLQAPEPFGCFEHTRGDPAQHHLAAPPALDVAFDVAGPADEALGGVGGGQRALETGSEAEREHGRCGGRGHPRLHPEAGSRREETGETGTWLIEGPFEGPSSYRPLRGR